MNTANHFPIMSILCALPLEARWITGLEHSIPSGLLYHYWTALSYYRVEIKTKPLEIVYNPSAIKKLSEFFSIKSSSSSSSSSSSAEKDELELAGMCLFYSNYPLLFTQVMFLTQGFRQKKIYGGDTSAPKACSEQGVWVPPPENFYFRTPGDAFSEHLRA